MNLKKFYMNAYKIILSLVNFARKVEPVDRRILKVFKYIWREIWAKQKITSIESEWVTGGKFRNLGKH